VRALLEHLERDHDVTVLLRASTEEEVLFTREFEALVGRFQRGRLQVLVGPRREHPMSAAHLRQLVPDVAERDVYVCGPESLNQTVIASAAALGIPDESVHCEDFTF
jgi:ferredoxin-NADP reductase